MRIFKEHDIHCSWMYSLKYMNVATVEPTAESGIVFWCLIPPVWEIIVAGSSAILFCAMRLKFVEGELIFLLGMCRWCLAGAEGRRKRVGRSLQRHFRFWGAILFLSPSAVHVCVFHRRCIAGPWPGTISRRKEWAYNRWISEGDGSLYGIYKLRDVKLAKNHVHFKTRRVLTRRWVWKGSRLQEYVSTVEKKLGDQICKLVSLTHA